MNRKLLLLFICSLIAVCSFAQNKTKANHENVSALLLRNNPKVKGTPSVNPFLQLRSDAVKQKLDSLLIAGRWKNELTYDDHNNLTMHVIYLWEDNVWVKDEKNEYIYDDNTNTVTEIWYSWGNNTWQQESKDEIIYDSNGKGIMYIYYDWDDNRTVFRKYAKEEYVYDNHGNKLLWISYDLVDNTWVEDARHEYKNDYTYDDNGNIKTFIRSYKSENEREERERCEYEYDAQNNIITKIRFVEESSGWERYDKGEYLYDNNRNLIMEATYYWSGNKWVGDYKSSFEFDLSIPFTDILSQEYYTYIKNPFYNKPIGGKDYSWLNDRWEYAGDYIFYYSDYKPNSIDEVSNLSLSVYPNPVQEYLFVTTDSPIDKVEIYNQIGSLVKTESNVSDKIDVSALNAGVYYLSIYLENKQVTKKIIKTP